jgi:DNA-binding Xre family transcriptional regulator
VRIKMDLELSEIIGISINNIKTHIEAVKTFPSINNKLNNHLAEYKNISQVNYMLMEMQKVKENLETKKL